MTEDIDPLDRTWHAHFDAPIVHHASMAAGSFAHTAEAVHVVDNVYDEHNVAFYANLTGVNDQSSASDELYVSLHGAATGRLRYPQFRRVQSLQGKVDNLLCFADPTLQLSEDSNFRIGWYAGGASWDPLVNIIKIVTNVRDLLACKHVAFIGSSAGGHAALRASAAFPNSLAFVMDPQTDITRYYWPSRNRFFEVGWPMLDLESAMSAVASRTNLLRIYQELNPCNFIYYRQSTGDAWHQRVHAEPFQESVSTLSGTTHGRFVFVYEEGEKVGHGKITSREFDYHLERAVGHWRVGRSSRTC